MRGQILLRRTTNADLAGPFTLPSRPDHEVRIGHGERDDLRAVALEPDLYRRRAGGMEGELSLMEDAPLRRADARHRQLIPLGRDDEAVARPVAEDVAPLDRRALLGAERLVAGRLIGIAQGFQGLY